ncbi:hypothetical protein [Hyphomicrobium sp. 99]|uniref:hypothetical protein n=1 Tax=Hyphomicrobium sp. 99 TaxID=1163419 RepID=UPI0005F80A5D|nr:hypothetical protein [Hyphomicrobium sp. 99]
MRQNLLHPRIERLARRDRKIAITAILLLWLLYGFVFLRLLRLRYDSDPIFIAAMGFVGCAVLLLNTVAIYALLQRTRTDSDKVRVYEPEIRDVD